MRNLSSRLNYANVMSTFGVFIALGLGTAYAADKIGSKDIAKDAVRSKHIKAGNVKNADLAGGAVNSGKVADGSLLGADFAPGQLPAGPDTPQQLLAKLQTVDSDTSGLNADTLDGKNADQLKSARIHVTGNSGSSGSLLPGLFLDTSCLSTGITVHFETQGVSGTANAMAVASGVEPSGFSAPQTFTIKNGAQNAGFAYSPAQRVEVYLENASGDAAAEAQLVIDAGTRTYSVALHMYNRHSDGYCEVLGTATLAE